MNEPETALLAGLDGNREIKNLRRLNGRLADIRSAHLLNSLDKGDQRLHIRYSW